MDAIYEGPERRAETFCPHKEKITKLDHAVNGNGSEGLRVVVAKLEITCDNTLENMNAFIKRYGKDRENDRTELEKLAAIKRSRIRWTFGAVVSLGTLAVGVCVLL